MYKTTKIMFIRFAIEHRRDDNAMIICHRYSSIYPHLYNIYLFYNQPLDWFQVIVCQQSATVFMKIIIMMITLIIIIIIISLIILSNILFFRRFKMQRRTFFSQNDRVYVHNTKNVLLKFQMNWCGSFGCALFSQSIRTRSINIFSYDVTEYVSYFIPSK